MRQKAVAAGHLCCKTREPGSIGIAARFRLLRWRRCRQDTASDLVTQANSAQIWHKINIPITELLFALFQFF